jgi:hypothetical protein
MERDKCKFLKWYFFTFKYVEAVFAKTDKHSINVVIFLTWQRRNIYTIDNVQH